MWGDIAIAFTIAFLTTLMTTPLTIKLANKVGAVDTPQDERRINKITMPRLGGLAVIAGFIVSVAYLLITMTIESKINLFDNDEYGRKLVGFAVGGLIIMAVCLYDDIKGAPAIAKLIAQIIAACVVIKLGGIKIENVSIPWFNWLENQIFYKILTVGWIVGITNAINLIDGLDGLSTGITLIACISLLVIFSLNSSPIIAILLITALAGSLVGFLPYNFNPAKTFIGDTGSNFLGYCISVISILGIAKTYTAIVIVAPIIVLLLPIFDTLSSIVRRLITGKSIKAVFKPDANHLHHKLLKSGFTQKQVVLLLYGLTATLGIFTVIFMESGAWKALSFAILVIIIIAVGYKEFFRQKLLGTSSEDDFEQIETPEETESKIPKKHRVEK